MDAGIPNRSYPCGVRALLRVQRETHLVVQRERALLLVQRETHLVVKRETVASIWSTFLLQYLLLLLKILL